MDEQNEESEKQIYINENIIDKGYNPEDLNAFIINRRAVSIEEINLNILKIEVEAFKNEQLQDTYTTIKKTMALTKRDEQLNELYSSQNIKINYLPLPECQLTKLEKEGKKISIKILNGKYEKVGGLFSHQMKFVFTIECPELESSVIRTMDDLEWLKTQLNEKYPLIYIPPIYINKKSNTEKPFEQMRYILKFFNALLRKKILRISPMLYQFLTLDNNKLTKYKEALNKRKFNLHLKMENFKSTKAEEEIKFIKQQIYLPNKFLQKLKLTEYNLLINDLNKYLYEVGCDFKNLSVHLKELSLIFGKIHSHSTNAEQCENTKNIFAKFRNILSHWSESFDRQSLFFGLESKEFFNYINCELNELNNIYSQFIKFKEDYEKIGIQLNQKKEKLFLEKKYDKWELSKEDEKKINEFKNNFNEASQYMCKDFSTLVEGQKIRVACSCNIILREFKRVDKYIGEQLMNFFNTFKNLCDSMEKDIFDERLFKI